MLTDIEIAQQCKLLPIARVAEQLGIGEEEWEPYGRYKAKLTPALFERVKDRPDGKLILVTAINPTPAGEGKTTTTAGLGEAMAKIGKKAVVALREPSLGPVFGVKGGAAGGGYAQVFADGGHQPAFYGRYARHYRSEQPALRPGGQSYPAGEHTGDRSPGRYRSSAAWT